MIKHRILFAAASSFITIVLLSAMRGPGFFLVSVACVLMAGLIVLFLAFNRDGQKHWRWTGLPQGFVYIIGACGLAASIPGYFYAGMGMSGIFTATIASVFTIGASIICIMTAASTLPIESLGNKAWRVPVLIGLPIFGVLLAEYLLATERTIVDALITDVLLTGLALWINQRTRPPVSLFGSSKPF